MSDRRGFVAGLTALLAGFPAFLNRATAAEAEPSERGVWRDSSDPSTHHFILHVDGYQLGYCKALNEIEQRADVDLAEPIPGHGPTLQICDGHFVGQRLDLKGHLEVYKDEKAHPNRGFRYWTGSGWINGKSEPIPGPFVSIIQAHVAGEALNKDDAVYIRNGRVYGA